MSFSAFKQIVAQTEDQRRTFFKLVWGPNVEGWVCVSYLEFTSGKNKILWFKYPDQLEEILASVKFNSERLVHFWFSPAIYKKPGSRDKQFIESCPNIWADLDKCDPQLLLVEPSILVQTSPGKFQALWLLEAPLHPMDAEDIARRIAYMHQVDGADYCWDAGHFLRIPYTPNHKYGATDRDAPIVAILHAKRSLYRPTDFAVYEPAPAISFVNKHSELPEKPNEDGDTIAERYRTNLPAIFWRTFKTVPEKDWSGQLFKLISMCIEAGMRREETFSVCLASNCNKYERDNRPETELWNDVIRCYVKHVEKTKLAPTLSTAIPEFLTAEETKAIQGRESFIERYISWASTLTDSPVQYHQASAFIALSAVLGTSVRLPTSFGVIKPNLWFMILAGTTLTRKTTSMRLGLSLLSDVDSELEMATDGSPEGILIGLRDRTGRASIFVKDEFTGLLEAIAHRDYMGGFAEQLTQLYDGNSIKRLLRKETIYIKDPVFIIYAAGIKERTQVLLTEDHIMGGFVPRFIFITGDADPESLQVTGPPKPVDHEARELLRNELLDIYNHYSQWIPIKHDGRVIGSNPPTFTASLTPDAWARYNAFESTMIKLALSTGLGHLVPVYDRLSTSALKAAILIAASRQRTTSVTVESLDVAHAIYYAQRWRIYASEIVNGIGKSQDERMIDRIYQMVRSAKAGVSRADIMNSYRLDAKRSEMLLTTMIQRQLLFVVDIGGKKFYKTAEAI